MTTLKEPFQLPPLFLGRPAESCRETDPVLQSRLFPYPDTHRYRLGVNYQQLPVNAPIVAAIVSEPEAIQFAISGSTTGDIIVAEDTLELVQAALKVTSC